MLTVVSSAKVNFMINSWLFECNQKYLNVKLLKRPPDFFKVKFWRKAFTKYWQDYLYEWTCGQKFQVSVDELYEWLLSVLIWLHRFDYDFLLLFSFKNPFFSITSSEFPPDTPNILGKARNCQQLRK